VISFESVKPLIDRWAEAGALLNAQKAPLARALSPDEPTEMTGAVQRYDPAEFNARRLNDAGRVFDDLYLAFQQETKPT